MDGYGYLSSTSQEDEERQSNWIVSTSLKGFTVIGAVLLVTVFVAEQHPVVTSNAPNQVPEVASMNSVPSAALKGTVMFKPPHLMGGDRDAHGCIPSAGYRWCEAKSRCIRTWEEGISSAEDFKAKCDAPVQKAQEFLRPLAAKSDGESEVQRPEQQQQESQQKEQLLDAPVFETPLGGTKDPHGCIPTAGYSWCEAKSSCIRPWEEGIRSEEDFKAKCNKDSDVQKLGGDADAHGCRASAGYIWCEAKQSCIHGWEYDSKCQLWCNCPPAEVVWSCSNEEYAAIRNGSKCPFYLQQEASMSVDER
eukprot:TRINITY_DN94481_c0_g1_i1.p1 TRINITY_DN94481_c0_g1~~TRINITY_DN94481_c0_g1_i1.p1  ORF type:complete len:306 (+),score=68.05 TRINITY_DN94481_c0_g1_i1:95-1012(+)